MPRPLLLLSVVGVLAGTVGAWGGVAGWLVKGRADRAKVDAAHAELRVYVQAASRYSEQAIRAEGELSWLRAYPGCEVR